jgi:MFS transporter, Spinster family, sphingosine-1-phosphate transporter
VTEVSLFAAAGAARQALALATPPDDRADAGALSALAIHGLGTVLAPVAVGVLSDRTSLGRALLVVPVAMLAAGAAWTFSAFRAERGARAAVEAARPARD